MINLKTCNRLELVTAYKLLEKRLAEYEQPQSKDDKEIEFQRFQTMTGNTLNEKQSRKLWFKLSDKKKQQWFSHYPIYKKDQPDRKFRVTNDKYLRHEKFNDSIKLDNAVKRPTQGARAIYSRPTRPQSTVDTVSRINQMR